jgi:hypothetical protein
MTLTREQIEAMKVDKPRYEYEEYPSIHWEKLNALCTLALQAPYMQRRPLSEIEGPRYPRKDRSAFKGE